MWCRRCTCVKNIGKHKHNYIYLTISCPSGTRNKILLLVRHASLGLGIVSIGCIYVLEEPITFFISMAKVILKRCFAKSKLKHTLTWFLSGTERNMIGIIIIIDRSKNTAILQSISLVNLVGSCRGDDIFINSFGHI
jgi:hypothetical protein